MKKGQYSVEKIISILQEAETGITAKEICRMQMASEFPHTLENTFPHSMETTFPHLLENNFTHSSGMVEG